MNLLHSDPECPDTEIAQQDAYFGVVTKSGEDSCSITVSVNNKPVEFEIDTGTEVTVISSKAHREIGNPSLHILTKTLRGPSNNER